MRLGLMRLGLTRLAGGRRAGPAAAGGNSSARRSIPGGLAQAVSGQARADCEAYLRDGGFSIPDEGWLESSFSRALTRVLIEAEVTVGLLPSILRIQLRREYEREFRRRLASKSK
ncbi:MAG TPA: hypothetical protein VMS56_05975 [Thermoanaerobaculia bacterium]|nr:hypothetical protein [Thermoanaerobaculia bacterium]